ncbi:MAG: porin [Alphaproteobacteria bacterium]|nr:porin [Alphaproteobacteria bacterium]
MSLGKYFLGSVAVGALLMTGVPAHAQSAVDSAVRSMRQQIKDLQERLQYLQTQINQTQQNQAQTQRTVERIKAAPPAPALAGEPFLKMHGISPTFSTPDGAFTMSITGRLHLDMGDYVNYSKKSASTTPNNFNGGVKARRARLGVTGKIDKVFGYTFIMDFGGSTTDNGSTIENGFVTYNGAAPFHFIAGYQDTPYSLDEATSSNDIMFLERASSQAIATGIAANDNRSAIGAWWNNDRAWVGVFGTGPASGTNYTTTSAQLGMTGRATYQIVQTPEDTFHVGIDGEELFKPAQTSGGARTLTLADSPELRIDNTQILKATVGTSANPVKGASVIGGEVAGNLGPLYAQGEYFHIMVDRQGQSGVSFNGGYVEASYALTGEIKKYNAGSGAYHSISPAHPFSPSSGGWGAWEIAARYSVMDLNDQLGSATGIAGGKQTTYTFGINWYPSSNLRFMLDYIHANIDKQSAPSGTTTNVGASMDAIAIREQFNF